MHHTTGSPHAQAPVPGVGGLAHTRTLSHTQTRTARQTQDARVVRQVHKAERQIGSRNSMHAGKCPRENARWCPHSLCMLHNGTRCTMLHVTSVSLTQPRLPCAAFMIHSAECLSTPPSFQHWARRHWARVDAVMRGALELRKIWPCCCRNCLARATARANAAHAAAVLAL